MFDRLQRLGVCISYGHSQTILDHVGEHYISCLRNIVTAGKTFHLVGDNVNWTSKVHDERMDRHGMECMDQ